jgi:hypothetical protein
MSIAEFLKDPPPATAVQESAPPVDPAAKLRKQVFLGFGAIIALGLALTGWYVGSRVFAGLPTSRPAAPAAITAAPTPASAEAVTHPPVVTAAPVPAAAVAKPVAPLNPPPVSSPVEAKPTEVPVVKPSIERKVVAVPETVRPAKSSQPVTWKVVEAPPISFHRRDATPQHGDRYLQVAAYGPRSLDAYLKTLEAQGLHPLVAPGPVDNIYRILIGPFPNTAALEDARHSIQASGIEPILRTY